MNNKNIPEFYLIMFFVICGVLAITEIPGFTKEIYSLTDSETKANNSLQQKPLLLAHRGCQEENETHCQEIRPREEMGHQGRMMGHQRGMGHRRGMHHRMRHGMGPGPGLDGKPQCPQERATAEAPNFLYNKKNPLENTQENIEKGRLIFELDAQPTCTACHGSGNGLGMMSGGLNPSPRNFTCTETMAEIPDGQLFWIIKNGSPGTAMPAFSSLSDEQIWQVIIFLRTLAN